MVPVICYILTLSNFKRKLPIGHCLRDVSGLFFLILSFFGSFPWRWIGLDRTIELDSRQGMRLFHLQCTFCFCPIRV